MSVKDSAETQLLFVGRLRAIEDSLGDAIEELDYTDSQERHANDLLVVACEAIRKAFLLLYGSAPEIEQRVDITGKPGGEPIEVKRFDEMPFTLLP
jgi:hypothetical protein